MIRWIVLMSALLGASSVTAEDIDVVDIRIAYLPEAADWCPAATGATFRLEMDGPSVASWPAPDGERFPNFIGDRRNAYLSGNVIAPNDLPKLGRFSLSVVGCQSIGRVHLKGTWVVSDDAGVPIVNGILGEELASATALDATKADGGNWGELIGNTSRDFTFDRHAVSQPYPPLFVRVPNGEWMAQFYEHRFLAINPFATNIIYGAEAFHDEETQQ